MNLYFENFIDSDFKSKKAKNNMKKYIKLHGSNFDNFRKIKNEVIDRFLVFDEKFSFDLNYNLIENDIKVSLIKNEKIDRNKLRQKLKNKINNCRNNNIHKQRKVLKDNNIIKKNGVNNNIMNLYALAQKDLKNKTVPSPIDIVNNKDKYINEIFEHVLFFSKKSSSKEHLIRLMDNNYINYLQTVCKFDYTKYLDQFFRKIKEHSHSNIPKIIDEVEDNVVKESELSKDILDKLNDSDSEEDHTIID